MPQPNPEIALSSGASSWLETKQTPEMAAIAESAMMSAGRGGGMDAGAARAARARAYEDLVAGGVLACSGLREEKLPRAVGAAVQVDAVN